MCDCLDQISAALQPHNADLDIPLRIDLKTGKTLPQSPALRLQKLDPKKRGRLPVLFARYCPFCGTAYAESTP